MKRMMGTICLAGLLIPLLGQQDCETDTDGISPTKVLLLGIDGLRPDALQAANTPNIDRLGIGGVFCDRAQAGNTTVSGPGWSNLLTGVWEDKHGVTNNAFEGQALENYPSIFTRVEEAAPDMYTAAATSWTPLRQFLTDAADYNFSTALDDQADDQVGQEGVRILSEENPDLLFLYFGEVDSTGHASGFDPENPEYIATIEAVDVLIGEVLLALESRSSFADEAWLVAVMTDHGGLGVDHSGATETERTAFVILNSPSIIPGTTFPVPLGQVDVAVTALEHLDIPVRPEWDLDGRAVEGPDPIPELYYGPNLLANPDAEIDPGGAGSTNLRLSGWRDSTSVTGVTYASETSQTLETAPDAAGANYFFGGTYSPRASLTQTLYVAQLADDIDAPMVGWRLDGWFGGEGDVEDAPAMTLHFRDELGQSLDSRTINGGSVLERDGQTAMVAVTAMGVVPSGTREINFYLEFNSLTEGNLGAVDNLSFALNTNE